MKKPKEYFLMVSRSLYADGTFKKLSPTAIKLLFMLKELEQAYGHGENTRLYRSNDQLADDTGMSVATVKKAKKELVDAQLMTITQNHFSAGDGKRSRKHISTYHLNV